MAPRSTPDSDLLVRFVDEARAAGWMVMPHSADSRRRVTVGTRQVLIPDPEAAGWPSLFLVNPAERRSMAVVIAREREKLTADQERWLGALGACGVETLVVRPSSELSAVAKLHLLIAA
ncbi:MAG TPA: hypothetical protein VMX12_08285 [Acidimicrobiia bacterium]|nr:hypothetical protein [Acidimicrobiia bacterium]